MQTRFLADESCDFAVTRQLRSEGHDVVAVTEIQQRSIDSELMEMAYREDRILLTEDKDFGWLAFVAHAKNPGVVLIRFPASARSSLPQAISQLVARFESRLRGSFIVLSPGSVRISSSPLERDS
jgi:predicted nuclease of predicted toxin-antitoxin system